MVRVLMREHRGYLARSRLAEARLRRYVALHGPPPPPRDEVVWNKAEKGLYLERALLNDYRTLPRPVRGVTRVPVRRRAVKSAGGGHQGGWQYVYLPITHPRVSGKGLRHSRDRFGRLTGLAPGSKWDPEPVRVLDPESIDPPYDTRDGRRAVEGDDSIEGDDGIEGDDRE